MELARLPISVTVITLNEVHSLETCLRSVSWAAEWIVVDSGSTDGTAELAQRLGAKVVYQEWLGYGAQKNVAHQMAGQEWVLNLDADEQVSPQLAVELQEFFQTEQSMRQFAGAEMPRKTLYLGKWIRHGGWYPGYQRRLSRKNKSCWTEPSVHERLEVSGRVHRFQNPLIHDGFASIEDQVQKNLRYSREGSKDLVKSGKSASLLMLVIKTIGKFLESYIWKAGFLDGIAGLIISVNAAHSIFLKYAYLFEERIRGANR